MLDFRIKEFAGDDALLTEIEGIPGVTLITIHDKTRAVLSQGHSVVDSDVLCEVCEYPIGAEDPCVAAVGNASSFGEIAFTHIDCVQPESPIR